MQQQIISQINVHVVTGGRSHIDVTRGPSLFKKMINNKHRLQLRHLRPVEFHIGNCESIISMIVEELWVHGRVEHNLCVVYTEKEQWYEGEI